MPQAILALSPPLTRTSAEGFPSWVKPSTIFAIVASPFAVGITTYLLFWLQKAVILNPGSVRPFGIGFLVPVILLAVLGGRIAGLTTLALSLVSLIFCLTPPYFTFTLNSPAHATEVGMVGLVGLIIVFAVDAFRRNVILVQQIRNTVQQQRTFMREVLINVTDGKLRLCETADELPQPLSHMEDAVPLSRTSVAVVRQVVEQAAKSCGMPAERRSDLITAASECAMNAVVHADRGLAYVSWDDSKVQVSIEDQGRGIDINELPKATFQKGFTTAGTLGVGFKLMLSSADHISLLTGSNGTKVVIEQEKTAPPMRWL